MQAHAQTSGHLFHQHCRWLVLAAGLLLLAPALRTQMAPPSAGPLDPARSSMLRLPEKNHEMAEFIWTAGDAAARDPALQASVRGQSDKIAPHYFRTEFDLRTPPLQATLYLAGPRAADVYLNGRQVLHATDDGTRPKNLTVLTAAVGHALRAGRNVLAVEAVRGHSSLHTGASATINQITYGEVLALKIVPAALAADAPPLLVSNTRWRSSLTVGAEVTQPESVPAWAQPGYADASWQRVESLGVLGSRRDFLQWNADAGLYAWPGYSGISDDLRVFAVEPASATPLPDGGVLLDFGRELSARLRLRSSGPQIITAIASYGESPEEAIKDKGYLGTRAIPVPAGGTAFGPKSGFRYVKLTGPAGANLQADAEAITWPVRYLGSFHSSDPLLDRIWETAAYTARLCMQEGIWDGVKRDRRRWMGDLDVTARTVTAVFDEHELTSRTMAEIIGESPVRRDVNTITGYSALWVSGEAELYRHTGDIASLRRVAPQLVDLLRVMEGELDPATALFTNPGHHKVFVDWSPDFNSDTAEARAATHFQFVHAFDEAAWLLGELGSPAEARHYRSLAARMRQAAQTSLLRPQTGDFGPRLQTNALAVLADAPDKQQRASIWQKVLANAGKPGRVITPYQGYYLLSAMAALDHRAEALNWMRQYWGGMLAEGATSFWESYDPHWPKQDFHSALEADNKRGYYVSLAHGWASGPAAFLLEEVLGIHPTAAGFREVTVRPDLAGLTFAEGAEPTPRGLLSVSVMPHRLEVTLPPGTRATVLAPFPSAHLQGSHLSHLETVQGRARIMLSHAGRYTITEQMPPSTTTLKGNP